MNTYSFNNYIFSEAPNACYNPADAPTVKLIVTMFDEERRAHSYYFYITPLKWAQALDGDETTREIIAGAFDILYKNGYLELLK